MSGCEQAERRRLMAPFRAAVLEARQAGFTLLELILVLLLVGILAVSAVPRLSNEDIDQRAFFDEVVAAARFARAHAIGSGCDVQLTLSADGYAVDQRSSCDSGTFTLAVADPVRGDAFAGTAPDGVSIAPVSAIEFDAVGRASSSVTVSVSGPSGSSSLEIVADSGYVRTP